MSSTKLHRVPRKPPLPGPKEEDTDPSTGGEECQITLKEEQVRLESML